MSPTEKFEDSLSAVKQTGSSKESCEVIVDAEQRDSNRQNAADEVVPPEANAIEHNGPRGIAFFLLMFSIYLSIFLIALDQLIISTAIPQITDEFQSIGDIGWYGSAYLLTSCSFQPMFGKIYTLYPVRIVYLGAILLFEVGSAMCGAAPSSAILIGGRVVQGVGAAGMFSGSVVGIVYAVPLSQRPLYMGLFGAMSGVASIMGPLVGGAFTSNVTWRWCFYINLPFGALSIVLIAILLRVPSRETTELDWKLKLLQLDAAGTMSLIPGIVCLLLALQWGGVTYSWNNSRIITLIVLAFVLLVTFVSIQISIPKTSTIPPRIFKKRSIFTGFWATFCVGSHMNLFLYFLPVWFQAIQGVSAVESGIRLLPMTLSTIISSIVAGALSSIVGYYTPFLLIGSCITAIGAGLINTLQIQTETSRWIGYQVLYGFGIGMSIQVPNLAAQTVLPLDDVPIGTSLMLFGQLLGGAIFVSVGQTVFNNGLVGRLQGFTGFNSSVIESNGATTLSSSLPLELKTPVLMAYNEALRDAFRVGLILVCLTMIGAAGMEWKSVKPKVPKTKQGESTQRGVGGEKSAPTS
ncbi:hypothetical protein M434DRAFT_398741 [Hypoxylon sp. CO27-5]|nr:hypothetical protein M434DRAFT_398741 [Hypoxylon sp. CO27-5]